MQSNLICENVLNDIGYEIINLSFNLQINRINDSNHCVQISTGKIEVGWGSFYCSFSYNPKICYENETSRTS